VTVTTNGIRQKARLDKDGSFTFQISTSKLNRATYTIHR
jgi:hypothetical protein